MDSDILSTINTEKSVDGIKNWNDSDEDSSVNESQYTEKKLVNNKMLKNCRTQSINFEDIKGISKSFEKKKKPLKSMFVDHNEIEDEYISNILIADDVASNLIALEFQLSAIRGPDDKR